MTFNGTADGWDLIVSPWHLDEHIPAWTIPAGATALVRPSLPAGSQLHSTNLLYNDPTTHDAITQLGAAFGAELAW